MSRRRYLCIYIYTHMHVYSFAAGAVSDISSASPGELVRWMRRAGLSYSLCRAVMDGDAEQASRSSRYAQSWGSRRAARVWRRCSRSKGGFWRSRAKLRTAGAGATQSNAAVVAPRQGGHESSRVGSSRAQGTTAGAARRLMSSRRRSKRIDREEKMAEEKMATSWRWGVGEKAAKMPVEAGTRDWPRQRSPPMVP